MTDPQALELIPGAGEAVRRVNEAGMLAVVVTNQSGAARGLFPIEAIYEAHDRLERLLAEFGAHIDAFYVCPHHPEGKVPELTGECGCRKPKTGLYDAAIGELSIDPRRSYAIGDSYRDLYPAAFRGARTVLVRTGHGTRQLEEKGGEEWQPRRVADDVAEAVAWVLADRRLAD